MPFYTKLFLNNWDTDTIKAKKKRTAAKLRILQTELRKHLKEHSTNDETGKVVRIATWNLREFGGGKFKGRDFEALYYIAEIISHFHIVALQEIGASLKEFYELRSILGPDWSFIATDVTDGHAGNGERMVFLYDRRNVQFRNIAGELTLKEGGKIRAAFGERINLEHGFKVNLPDTVDLSGIYAARMRTSGTVKKLDADLEIPLPANSTLDIPPGSSLVIPKNSVVTSPQRGKASVTIPSDAITGTNYKLRFPENSFDDSLRQFARTPFLISFQSGWLKINLCTVHILYGDATDSRQLEQRRSEIEQLTAALANKAKTEFKEDKESFLGVLGDFNIIGQGHPTMEALESEDFVIPEALKSIPGSNVARDKAYDQIAFWKPDRNTGYARLDITGANIFDFFKYIFTDEDADTYREEEDNGLKPTADYKLWRTYKMSDHLPMWIALRSDFSNEYFEQIQAQL